MNRSVRLDAKDDDEENEEHHGNHVRYGHPGHFFNFPLETVVDQIRRDVESRGYFRGKKVIISE